MKKLVSALFGLVVLGAIALRPQVAEAAQNQIGYVNLQRAIVETEDGKKAKAKLEATFKKKQKALRSKEQELEAMKEQVQAAAMKSDDPKARAQVLEFQKKFLALRKQLMEEQQELQKLEGQALEKITKRLRKIIREIGKEEGYLLIMEAQESSLLFAKAHLDLTNEVIRKYNARH